MTIEQLRNLDGNHHQSTEKQLVKVVLGGIDCAIDILLVKEIILPGIVQPIFSENAFFVGITDHRDNALPVVDLRKKLNIPGDDTTRDKWVIVSIHHREMALMVDKVEGVTTVRKSDERSSDVIEQFGNMALTRKVYSTPDGLLLELNLDALHIEEKPSGVPATSPQETK